MSLTPTCYACGCTAAAPCARFDGSACDLLGDVCTNCHGPDHPTRHQQYELVRVRLRHPGAHYFRRLPKNFLMMRVPPRRTGSGVLERVQQGAEVQVRP